ncbi:cell division ATP-binding protein FtsE [Candidatus Gottesmanbacteria bacterium RIFCSPLOWO2_01_FULL_48_11]|uniref:Cell division ATP-binding protein FtsE n=3 Tax=Patescibacteria group TaxID=1783273 RepID=A0A1F6ASU7_9BACT|nr:MAG: Cell division ATP-binding protein FtsE [Parcubacteria group bacterium GW2011_GWA2_46_10]KKU21898.1 MAG: Cell division ATP-binding protein FtsE [Candidatus Nomurabacteria bacterium GW2011_GWA1_46_11]OGG27377.1 MAG: cell division ATP-binding protein FtsE [Candidatus Gottesmanbacteria bacterium RIFCSPLOWO2_01_FULL_48_11]OGY56168.1 MAG: cell division ATP-binding protein FtsE [Candidatus Colwellbacteria bacterium GWA2_46_10]
MIYFEDVSKEYGGGEYAALRDITFKIEPKEFVSIVGKSGAGKSTIVRLLIGEEKPTKGRVVFGEYEVNTLRPKELPELRRQVGVIFQDFRLLPTKNAYENVAFALEVAGVPERDIDDMVREALDLVGLSDKADNFVHQLSGGEAQRVALARAMVNHPKVVVADEPTGNLDPLNTADVIKVLEQINQLGTTVILTTHNKDVVDRLGKRVIHLDGGRIIRDAAKGKYTLA